MRQFVLEVWGDFACFTRPEAKVERLSYPVMTPSAARGLLDAIYAKPLEFRWQVTRIEVLNPIQFMPLRRNEVKEKISINAVKKAMKEGEMDPIIADATKEFIGNDQKGRTQRQTIALRDVRYRLYAHIEPRPGFQMKLKGLEEQAFRRMSTGKCYYQPYFGCKEFVAYFDTAISEKQPIDKDLTIGWMIYDVFDLDKVNVDDTEESPFISVFWAELRRGVLEVPVWDSDDIRKRTDVLV